MSPATIKINIASLSESSLRQYEVELKKWWKYCLSSNAEIFSTTINQVLQFLTNEFENGASYGSINSFRSSIALILGPEIGNNPDIKRFCRGASNLRPALPKYNTTWDPKIVLDFVTKWFPNEEISMKQLSEKLATLLALTTSQRMQTLSAIDIRNIQKTQEYFEIKIPAQLKTSGHQKLQPNLILPFYPEDPTICVAGALEVYLRRTDCLQNTTNLFISWKKPYNAISTQSLSRWIKRVLEESGIDSSTFTAYSTRHAATSTAKHKGISIDLIKKTAGWTQSSQTFARFYDRKIIPKSDNFAKAILKSKVT